MSQISHNNDNSEVDHQRVVAYLSAHADFFAACPDLLAQLQIPHASGKAVSLLEKQVEVLRGENRQLKTRFHELISIAQENEELARRMHRLTLKLIEADSGGTMLAALQEGLSRGFAAEAVLIRLFAEAANHALPAELFVGASSPARQAFVDTLLERKPQCGRLKRPQSAALFGTHEEHRGSAVVLPLSGRQWDGVLVIISNDPKRYHEEMGIDLLAHLGDVASLILQPWMLPG